MYEYAAEVFVEKSLRRKKTFGPSGHHTCTCIFLGYAHMCNGYVFYIPELDRVVTQRDAAFDEGHLPCTVGETSIAKPNTTPGIKLDALSVDKIQNIPTTASSGSMKSGGKPSTKLQSSGGIVTKPTSIIRLTGKMPKQVYR